nr:trans-resveratrol di-O-methyltransferase [Arachis hypogaea]
MSLLTGEWLIRLMAHLIEAQTKNPRLRKGLGQGYARTLNVTRVYPYSIPQDNIAESQKSWGFQSGEQANNMLKAQCHIWNHMYSFVNTVSLKCAVDLDIFETIHKHGKPMSLSQLIASLQIHPSKTTFIHRLIRILTHSDFFATTNVADNNNEIEIGYVLTDSSMLLLKEHPLSIRTFFVNSLDPILTNPWNKLSTWYKNEDPTPFETEHGIMVWEYGGREPRLNHLINDAMASDARFISEMVIEKCKGVFEGLESLVDVGGGNGTLAKAIAKSFPQLECTVLDQPHVVADLEGSDNLKYVGGNMFEAIPPADAVLMKGILHDWNDKECINILKKSNEAILSKGKEGKLIIIDMVVQEDEKEDPELVETQLFFDLLMLVMAAGKERSEKEWAKLFFSAGFSDYKIIPVLGMRSVIEVYP